MKGRAHGPAPFNSYRSWMTPAKARPDAVARAKDSDVDELSTSILLASRALVGVAARSLSAVEGEVTLVQYRALVLLASRGPQNVSSLAEGLSIHPSTTTRLCDRLADKGLIQRLTSSASRREITLTLTPAGQSLLKTVNVRRKKEIKQIVERIPLDLRKSLSEAFTAFGDAAGEIHDDAWKLGDST
jgi:DNA-binding MarR family transcriptional regulator